MGLPALLKVLKCTHVLYLNLTKKFAVNLQGCCKTKKILSLNTLFLKKVQISDFLKAY
jgi:hypothetical protein